METLFMDLKSALSYDEQIDRFIHNHQLEIEDKARRLLKSILL